MSAQLKSALDPSMPIPEAGFHVSPLLLRPGDEVVPGNYGRIISARGKAHQNYRHERALEAYRRRHRKEAPSRLDVAYFCPTEDEARQFRGAAKGFAIHPLYRVRVKDPDLPRFMSNVMFTAPLDRFPRKDWADLYWMDEAERAAALNAMGVTDWPQIREVLTTSALIVEAYIA